jgi:hypothetical protein
MPQSRDEAERLMERQHLGTGDYEPAFQAHEQDEPFDEDVYEDDDWKDDIPEDWSDTEDRPIETES